MEDDHLSERKVKYYLCHVLMALDSLHTAGIIHREVEPQNTPII
jgi:serine/threonine protein kinase